jgi:heme exporter protein D
MAFDSIADFFAMGGYGFYVWLSYGVSLFALLVLILNTIFTRKKLIKNVQQNAMRAKRIQKAQKMEGTL